MGQNLKSVRVVFVRAAEAGAHLAVRVLGGVIHRGGHVSFQELGAVGVPRCRLFLLYYAHHHRLRRLRACAGAHISYCKTS